MTGPNLDMRRSLQVLKEAAFGSVYLPEWVNSTEFREKSAARQLLWILGRSRSKEATVPHDLIYGLLGMVDLASFPNSLRPDYRQSYKEAIFHREHPGFAYFDVGLPCERV